MIKAKKQLIFILAILIFALPLCACNGESEAGVSIVTTIFAPYDFAREVAGENASVKMLLSPGADSHSYDPTPKDMLAVKKCDIFICVGGTSDPVGEYGKGVKKVCRMLHLAGVRSVKTKLYRGARHEILNEACFPTVCEDILAFAERVI